MKLSENAQTHIRNRMLQFGIGFDEYIERLIKTDMKNMEVNRRITPEIRRDLLIYWHHSYCTNRELAKLFNISQNAVSEILSQHLAEERDGWGFNSNRMLKNS